MTVTKEVWNSFLLAMEEAPDGELAHQCRFALEAVAPLLIAQGMREAVEIMTGGDDYELLPPIIQQPTKAILARAQELDPK